MRSIRVLPNEVISRIAAGEVIERPASVVKELMENSIDAGADRIAVKIDKAGKRLIRVVDNGVGMSKEDLEMCVKRHATSKIYSLDELFSISTLGFRGEALPSIASVSKLRIISKPHNQLIGHKIEIEAGSFISLEETGAPDGTIVEVKDLFFNIPARRKFLRSERVEMSYLTDTFIRIALAYKGIHFSLEHGNKLLLNLPSTGDLIQRFCLIFGSELLDHIIEAKQSYKDLTLTIYLTTPEASRSKPDRIFFYVNGRNVRDKLIMKAVLDGYGERLAKGKYPQGMVFIDIDPKTVDVNVHPTKQQIRFQNESEVYEAVLSCIKKVFKIEQKYVFLSSSYLLEKEEQYSFPEFSLPKIIGQIKNTYIICEDKEGIVLIDQHAAHERIIYERLKKGFVSGKIESQRLVEPYRIELSPTDAIKLSEKIDMFLDIGIEIKPFGGNTFLLLSFPSILKQINWKSFISDLLDSPASLEEVLKVMACHGAIKAGDKLNIQQMQSLIEELYRTELPQYCPHGRPVFKKITYLELEKMFMRK